MEKFFLIIILCITCLSCRVGNFDKSVRQNYQSYSLDAYNSNDKIYFERDTIFSVENYMDKSVLVIIDNNRKFAKNVDIVLDTLNPKYRYRIVTKRDSIGCYSDLKIIQKVLIID